MSAHVPREAAQERHSAETRISLRLNLDGEGKTRIQTGFGLLDHMLTLAMFWAGMDLQLSCQGDLNVDAHHSVEDVGLTLGRALLQALGDRAGIARVGYGRVPMDEALSEVTVDLSGRPWLEWRGDELLPPVMAGEEKDLWREFTKLWRAAPAAICTLPFYTAKTATTCWNRPPKAWAWPCARPCSARAQPSEAPREALINAYSPAYIVVDSALPDPGRFLRQAAAQHGRGAAPHFLHLQNLRGALYPAHQRQPAYCGTHP